MSDIGAWVKEHPLTTGAVVIGGLVLLLVLSKSGSSGGSNVAASEINADSQLAQVNAASQAQTQQTQAQLAAVQAQAQVASNQANAAVSAQNTQTAAQLILGLQTTNNQTNTTDTANELQAGIEGQTLDVQAQSNTLQAGVANNEIQASVNENTNNNATALAGLNAQIGGTEDIANLQAGLQSTALADTTTLQQQLINNQYLTNNTILQDVGAAGLNHGTASLENDLTAIIAGVEGQPGIGQTAAASSGTAAAASASSTAAIFSSLFGAISKVATGLFS
jgi:hypothetical protein